MRRHRAGLAVCAGGTLWLLPHCAGKTLTNAGQGEAGAGTGSTTDASTGDDDASNNVSVGCDADTQTNTQNCGRCGRACRSDEGCYEGACAVLCEGGTPCDRRVFVTSGIFNGAIRIEGADQQCKDAAARAGLRGTFLAWLSGYTVSPSSRFSHSTTPYRLPNGTLVANDWAQLISGALAAPINQTELGTQPGPEVRVWTATLPDGNLDTHPNGQFGNDCQAFQTTYFEAYGTAGSTNAADAGWTQAESVQCATPLALYCFQQ
jgi:hypothetical protein